MQALKAFVYLLQKSYVVSKNGLGLSVLEKISLTWKFSFRSKWNLLLKFDSHVSTQIIAPFFWLLSGVRKYTLPQKHGSGTGKIIQMLELAFFKRTILNIEIELLID